MITRKYFIEEKNLYLIREEEEELRRLRYILQIIK